MKRVLFCLILLPLLPGLVVADYLDETLSSPVIRLIESVGRDRTIGVGSIRIAGAGVSTELSSILQDRLLEMIPRSGGTVVNRTDVEALVAEMRLSLSGLLDEADAPDPGLLRSMEVLLSGTYRESGTAISLLLNATDVETGLVVASERVSFSRRALPPDIAVRPENYEDALFVIRELSAVAGESTGRLDLRAWTDRGEGGVYTDGEHLEINLFAGQACYVKLYHIDVAGNTQLIFPNEHYPDNFIRAGEIVRIPDERYPFSFVLGPPYGSEFIKAVASTVQFSEIEDAFENIGMASRAVVSRGLSVEPRDELRAEALISITIIEPE